ncbi:MAG: hypothetical protein ABSF26_13065 [Thermoguttaceae bacterium]
MAIRIHEYEEGMTAAVAELNGRLRAGGVGHAFPTSPLSTRLPRLPGRKLFQQYYLALDQRGAVRGGYVLQSQPFWIGGRIVDFAFLGLPISEGVVDRKFVQVGVQLLCDALRRQPLLFGLGLGGYGEAIAQLLRAAGWSMFSVPFAFRVVRPFPFLRNIAHLRRSAPRRWLLEGLAFSGTGWAALKALQALRPACRPDPAAAELVEEFSDWSDEIWESCKGHYPMAALRDAQTLRILYPPGPKYLRLKIVQARRPIGWAVLLRSQLAGHKQFGNMRLGSIADGFAAPADAAKVVACARRFLEAQGVDLIVSNQSHRAWTAALGEAGFLAGPSNFIFAASKPLARLLADEGLPNEQLFLNRGDGDGPINL